MLYNDYTATQETLLLSSEGVWQTTDNKGEWQKVGRESDNLIVPMKQGNACRGKEITYYCLN
jgi:hypothetical protein